MQQGKETERIEAFSDGVFGIALAWCSGRRPQFSGRHGGGLEVPPSRDPSRGWKPLDRARRDVEHDALHVR